MAKPTYVINGFLESGKTSFFRYTLAQPYFKAKGRTLLIVCEEGEEAYGDALLTETNTVIVTIDDEASFTPERLKELDKEYDPERVLIEWNGMWDFRNMQLPAVWHLEQQMTTIDASTFSMYFTNMKSLLAEQLRNSELVMFNRCDGMEDLASFKRNVKAITQKADIIFEDENGEINVTLDEDLPFDLSSDPIELNSYGFGMFYLDALENLDRYEGRQVHFSGMVLKPRQFPKDRFVPGRMAMTCCAQDMQFLGFVTQYRGAYKLKDKEWVDVTARVGREYVKEYHGEGPVLEAISVEKCSQPENPVIDFANPN
ncbi:MAG: GTPase [Lachnospiraceae bacterium]|nr:GTPase [Lachnospiraceae bacterium]